MTYPPFDLANIGDDGSWSTDLTTDEWWSIDGVPLQTYAWNIASWGGDRQGTPPLRGRNARIPYLPGERFLPKMADSRTIELSGFVIGANRDGSVRDQARFRENWRMLRRLLYGPRRQVQIVRRWREDGEVRAAVGYGQVLSGMRPLSTSPLRADWVADVHLADPFFYGDVETMDFIAGQSREVEILGDDTTTVIEVTMQGPMSNPGLEVVGGDWLRYGTVVNGRTAVLNVRDFTAREGTTNTLGKVSRQGGYQWLSLPPGRQTIRRTGTGSGLMTLRYRPAWV